MDVTYDSASSTIYLDLAPGSPRAQAVLAGHHHVVVDLDRSRRAVGLGLVLVGDQRLSGEACTALLRYCPEIVGDALRPNWDGVRDHLVALAGRVRSTGDGRRHSGGARRAHRPRIAATVRRSRRTPAPL